MRTVNGILFFIFAAFPNPIELFWPCSRGFSVHPDPIHLDVHYYESSRYRGHMYHLTAGFYKVAVDKDHKYIIGALSHDIRHLCPLMVRTTEDSDVFERVKVRIDDNIANVTVPILKHDPLNDLFFKAFRPKNVRAVQCEKRRRCMIPKTAGKSVTRFTVGQQLIQLTQAEIQNFHQQQTSPNLFLLLDHRQEILKNMSTIEDPGCHLTEVIFSGVFVPPRI